MFLDKESLLLSNGPQRVYKSFFKTAIIGGRTNRTYKLIKLCTKYSHGF